MSSRIHTAKNAGEKKPFPAAPTAANSTIHESILDTIGNTPVIKINNLCEDAPGVNVYAKLEAFNPMGSVKDRLAVGVLEWAERHGQIRPGQTVIEASSGNTGIGLAMTCAVKGYPFVCVMAESFSVERRKLMRFLGAKVVLTNPAHKGSGMIIKANELAEKHGYFLTHQFENEANAWIHKHTTGQEILQAFTQQGRQLDHVFLGYGTGGTLLGVGQALKEGSPETLVHACEPSNAPMLFSGVKQEYGDASNGELTTFKRPHPVWRPHLLQGWSTDFIPGLVTAAVDENIVKALSHVSSDDAIATSIALAKREGIFCGISGGGSMWCALQQAKISPPGTNILAFLPDTGERYLSTPLFAGIPADMTAEEQALADSTPSSAPPDIEMPPVTEESLAFVRGTNGSHKVVMWSLEYCEFCWTLSALLGAVGVKFEVVNIDAFKYARDQQGNKYRSALSSLTGCKTFPQLFIGGDFVGGSVDACLLWKKGELQCKLVAAGVSDAGFAKYTGDPFEFLPKWMTQNPFRSK